MPNPRPLLGEKRLTERTKEREGVRPTSGRLTRKQAATIRAWEALEKAAKQHGKVFVRDAGGRGGQVGLRRGAYDGRPVVCASSPSGRMTWHEVKGEVTR